MYWVLIPNVGVFALIVSAIRVMGKRIYELKAMESPPPPPVNVRLVLRNGEMVPVDTMHSELRVWIVIMPNGIVRSDVGALAIEKLPPLTAVHIPSQDEQARANPPKGE